MKTCLSSQGSHELRNNRPNLEELCPFAFDKCKQEVDVYRCRDYFEKCIVYLRLKVLERNPVLTGLQRFQLKYKDFDYGRQLGT